MNDAKFNNAMLLLDLINAIDLAELDLNDKLERADAYYKSIANDDVHVSARKYLDDIYYVVLSFQRSGLCIDLTCAKHEDREYVDLDVRATCDIRGDIDATDRIYLRRAIVNRLADADKTIELRDDNHYKGLTIYEISDAIIEAITK